MNLYSRLTDAWAAHEGISIAVSNKHVLRSSMDFIENYFLIIFEFEPSTFYMQIETTSQVA